MSIAIATSKGDVIYFDAVLSYDESYANAVTKHPVDGGGVISDHVTMENPCFSIEGIISAVDFNDTRPSVQSTTTGKAVQFININPIAFPVDVRDNDQNTSLSLPFLSGLTKSFPKPTVQMADEVKFNFDRIKNILKGLRDNNANADSNYGLFSVYEFRDGLISGDPKNSCVIVSLDFKETPETGDVIEVGMKIEQVVFVPLSQTTLPKDVANALKDKSSDEKSKGKQGDAPTETPTTPPRKSVLLDGAQSVGLFQ